MSDLAFSDDSRAEFAFGLNAPSTVTLETWSYAGGTNYAGQQIPAGGFDPVVSVFDTNGVLIEDNDDGSSVVDPATGLSYDSLLTLDLSTGDYLAVLTEYPNRSDGNLADGFPGSGRTTIADGVRTGYWALDILDVDAATFLQVVNPGTEPAPPPAPIQEEIDTALQEISVNSNTSSTADVIGTACPQAAIGTQFRDDCTPIVVGALDPAGSQANAQASVALAAVTDEQATVPLASSRASISSQSRNLSTRLSALRAGATGLSVQGLTWNMENQDGSGSPFNGSSVYSGIVDGMATGGAASGDGSSIFANERLGAFINGTVSSANKDASSNEEGFDANSWAITAGVDYRFLDNLIAGAAVGYFKSTTDIDNNGGDLDTDGYSFSLYGTYYHGDNLYVDGIVTYGNNDYDQERNIRYQVGATQVSQSAKADYGGDQWSAAVAAGYNLASGPWSYGPVLQLQYVSANVDGYSESMSNPGANGGAWAARLDNMNQESFTTDLGADVSRAISTTWGVVLPQLHLGWVHEYRNNAVGVNGSFIQDPTGGIFAITGDSPDSDYFNARLGVSAQFAGGTSGFLYYNKVFGYRDLDVDTVGAGVRLVF